MDFKQLTKEDITKLFRDLDTDFLKNGDTITVTLLGGVAALMQGYIERATQDIDVAPVQNCYEFQQACSEKKIKVDIVTVASVASYDERDTLQVFKGKALTVRSVDHKNLIKLKLERFVEQDRSDIINIIEATKFSYSDFKATVQEALLDYVGRGGMYVISAAIIVEDQYPEHIKDFESTFNI